MKNKKLIVSMIGISMILAMNSISVNANQSKNINNQEEDVLQYENFGLELDDYDYKANFSWDKKAIIESLQEEASFAEFDEIKKQINSSIELLSKINNFDKFYETLDKEYGKIDEIYEKVSPPVEYDFETDKKFIIDEMTKEINSINDSNLKEKLSKKLAEINKITNEDEFFEKINEIYSDSDLFKYYEENWIEMYDYDDVESYDFETIKKEVLEQVEKDFWKDKYEELAKITDEDEFYDRLYEYYEF